MDLEASRKANSKTARVMRLAVWTCFVAAGCLLIVSLTATPPTKSGFNIGQTPADSILVA